MTDLSKRQMLGRVALARGLEYRKAHGLGQAKKLTRVMLRQPKSELKGELAPKQKGTIDRLEPQICEQENGARIARDGRARRPWDCNSER
jgi:hypothetical protein